MGALECPLLGAGDMLVLAGTTLLAWHPGHATGTPPPRLVELVLSYDHKTPGQGTETLTSPSLEHYLATDREDATRTPPFALPPWFEELSPEQQAVCGGHPEMGAVVIAEDGETSQLLGQPPRPATEAATQDECEQWQFETQGYLVVEGVMDVAWLAKCNEAADLQMRNFAGQSEFSSGGIAVDMPASGVPADPAERFVPPPELADPACSDRLKGSLPSRAIGGGALLGMQREHSDAFRRMIGHAAIVRRFNWMLGEGWYMSASLGSLAINPHGCVSHRPLSH
jgi:hypothetical protein